MSTSLRARSGDTAISRDDCLIDDLRQFTADALIYDVIALYSLPVMMVAMALHRARKRAGER